MIDFFVFREGEYAFSHLLDLLMNRNLDGEGVKKDGPDIPNTYYLNDNTLVAGTQNPPIKELDEIPSPYLTGLFDELLRDIKITPLMQFVRGCPFKCTFCQEGEDYFNKVRRYR